MAATHEFESSVAAPRLFRAAILDWHKLAPKLTPEIVASAELVHGDGVTIGSVRQLNLTEVMPFKFVKERLDFLDMAKCESKWTLFEGADIGQSIKTATTHVIIATTADGGSHVKVESTYELMPGVEATNQLDMAKHSLDGIFKTTEAYLIANPDAYN